MYYSRTKKTAIAANALANKVSGNLIEIKDLKNRNGILGWIRAAMDARGANTTQIEPSNIDTSNYDTLCFGTPVWGSKPTPAFNTMIQNFEITGKDIILFVTLGGLNDGGTLNLMSQAVKAKGGNVIKTFAITKSSKKNVEEIENEINEIDI